MAFKIGKIYSDNIVEGNCFKMPQVFHGDHKDTVFILNFPEFAGVLEQEITITPIIAHCSYRLVKTEENRQVQAPLSFSVIEGPDFIVSNDDVYVHLCRVKTAEYMKAATAQGNGGDFPLARKTCDEGIAYLKDSLVSNHEIIKVLISDLEQAKDRFVDVQSWNSGGFAQVQMMQNCHYKQQSSTVSPMYQTPAQMNSVEAAQLFMKKG